MPVIVGTRPRKTTARATGAMISHERYVFHMGPISFFNPQRKRLRANPPISSVAVTMPK